MKRYKHNLSNTRLTTGDMGLLIPVQLIEALPGDTIQLSTSAMIRVSPLAAPVMHPVNVRIHHFFVPHRLVWDGWEDFITGGPDGMNADSPPTISPTWSKGSLLDYYGIPESYEGGPLIDLPFRGYNLIWNEWFRDQDLVAESNAPPGGLITLPVMWGKDYFTTARPWTQKGPEVTLPLGAKAPISGLGTAAGFVFPENNILVNESGGVTQTYTHSALAFSSSPAQALHVKGSLADSNGRPEIFADLSAAGAININDFRRAFALQRYQEARARYGSRYTEYLRYLGVTPSDARLQRPEYLGGGTARLNFSEVLQTAQANRGAPDTGFGVGDLYGHGVAGVRSGRVRRFIEEHGYIHTFLSVRPKSIYMNGVHRTFLRRTKEDYYQKELEQIGQQAILKPEIYADPGLINDVFGYQDRYSEYKSNPSLVTGEFRDILNYWHLARDLPETTALNQAFVTCVPTKRVLNVQTNDALWINVQNRTIARRMVRKSGSSRIM